MKCRIFFVSSTAVVLAFLGSSQLARAGILADTVNAISSFNGTRTYSNVFINVVNTDVDYAAFAPGDFDLFLTENTASFAHGVPANHYVYAYQLHVLSPTSPDAETFTVGTTFSGTLGNPPSFIPLSVYGTGLGENGDEEPTSGSFTAQDSALWDYASGGSGILGPGEWSAVMFYSSTDGPTWDNATLRAGLAAATSNPLVTGPDGNGVPTPSPEPGTSILFGLGWVFLVLLNRKRQNG